MFGTIAGQTSSTDTPLHAFTGREWDAEAGLYYYRARWYDATTGRFVSNDPIGFAGLDTNLARYVQNSPTSFIDPTGNTAVSSGASWRPTASDIQDVTGRYNRYLNWLSTVWNAVMCKAGGTNLITTVYISNVGYFHVYSPSNFLQPSEWMATIAYDRNDPDDMLIAELTARRIQDRMTVDAIGGITTSAIVNGFDIAIRTAFDPIDTLASFVEFTKKPSWPALLGMVPLIPGTMGRLPGQTSLRGAPSNIGPISSKAPRNVEPGPLELEGHYVDDLGRVQPWRAHYDGFGRLIGRTDYNAGNRTANIPDVLYERWQYSAEFPLGRKVDDHLLGEFPQ